MQNERRSYDAFFCEGCDAMLYKLDVEAAYRRAASNAYAILAEWDGYNAIPWSAFHDAVLEKEGLKPVHEEAEQA